MSRAVGQLQDFCTVYLLQLALLCAPAADHVPTERHSASLYPWNLGGGYCLVLVKEKGKNRVEKMLFEANSTEPRKGG